MSFIRQLIERKISAATGAAVMFGEFKFSPMSGTVEALSVKVAAERFVPPFLSIDRVEAKVAVARALKGEIAIKSLVIDRPVMIYNIHADGKTNLPAKPHVKEESLVPKEGAAGGTWEINAEKIELNHGRFEFRDATRDNYKISIEGINITVTPQGSDLAITFTADSIGRRDRIVDVGTIKMLGKLSGGGFRDPLASSFSARASIADALVLQITSSLIANRSFDVEVAGPIRLALLTDMLPLSVAQTWALEGDGSVDVRGKFTVEQLKHIRVHNLQLNAADFSISRTFGHFQGDGLNKPGHAPHPPVTT